MKNKQETHYQTVYGTLTPDEKSAMNELGVMPTRLTDAYLKDSTEITETYISALKNYKSVYDTLTDEEKAAMIDPGIIPRRLTDAYILVPRNPNPIMLDNLNSQQRKNRALQKKYLTLLNWRFRKKNSRRRL